MADIEKKVKVTFEGDSRDLKQALNQGEKAASQLADTTAKEASKTSKSLSSIALSAKGVVTAIGAAIGAVASVAAAGLREFIEADKVMKITQQTIKSTGGAAGITAKEVAKIASELQKVTLYDDDAIQGAQNLLLTFKNIGSDIFPKVTEAMLNMSQAMGTDLQGSAIQLGKALNDPEKGISALTRVGVQFTDTQKAQIENFIKQNDLAGAQAIILAELESQFGGVARTAATGTGIYQQFGNTLSNIMEVGGGVVDGFIQPAVRWLNELGNRFIDSGAASTTFKVAVGAIMIPLQGLAKVIEYIVVKPLGMLFDALGYGIQLMGVDLPNSLTSLKALFIGFGGEVMKIPLALQDAWLGLKQTAYQVIADTSDYFNKSIAAMQDAANKIPFLEGKFGRGGSETLSNLTQGATSAAGDIGAERQGLQNQMAGIDAATNSAISQVATDDTGLPTNEEGTAYDPKAIPTEAGLEKLTEAQQKKLDRLAEQERKAKEKALAEEQAHQDAMNQTLAGALALRMGDLKGSHKDQQKATADFHNNMLALSNSSNKSLAAIGKAYAISDAIINTYKAANLALATLPPPFGQVAAAAAVAAGLANVKAIVSTNPQSSAIAGTTSGLALGSVSPNSQTGVSNGNVALNKESDYYKNKIQVEFVGDAARVLQAVNKEGQSAGFI